MFCPVCHDAMLILEYNEVEVDYCDQCHGIWLDAGELDLLLGEHSVTKGFMTAGTAQPRPGEKPRRCPECGSKMKKEATGGGHPVTYDLCPKGHGLWFDQGELTTVLKYGTPAEEGEAVVAWLREMFPEQTPRE